MQNQIYQAGVARADITPPIGINLIGYAVREGRSHSIDQPLTVTALALRGGENTVLLVSIDVAILRVPFAAEIRAACGRAAGVPAHHVLLNCNHTHCSPGTPGYWSFGRFGNEEVDNAFAALVMKGCVDACREAVGSLRDARLSVGWGECHGNINRRQALPEGGTLMGENPDGPCDHSVGVLRVDALDGLPIAIAYRYSCHTVTLGPKTNIISPDFIGPARSVVEDALGCPSLFLQGCAGNINPATGIGQDRDSEPNFQDDQRRLGNRLGGVVLETAERLRTNRVRKEPVLVQSISLYWLYEYKTLEPGGPGSISVRESKLKLPLTPFPLLEEVEAERAEWAAKLNVAKEKNVREWELLPLVCFDIWAQLRLDAARSAATDVAMPSSAAEEIEFPIQVIRLGEGDAAFNIVALPFEAVSETGTALRDELGENTFVLGYSNGIVSYLPTPEMTLSGGMEAKLGYKNYMLPSELPGSWEPQIRAEAEKLAAS